MRSILFFLVLIGVASAQVVTTNTNVNIPQRNASGRLTDRNLLGSGSLWEAIGFNGSGVLDTLSLWEMTPSTGKTANKYLQINSAGTALEWDDGSTATIADGDKGDITTSASGATWTIDDGSVDTGAILDGTILNADISASAAIALSKLATDPLARANHTGTQAWSTITGTPTTVAGYGILDAEVAAGGAILFTDAGGKETYTPASDTDAARGTALISAVAAMAAGDTLVLGPGDYEITTTQLVIPAGGSLIGQGWGTTSITGEKRTNNVKVANNVTLQGIKFITVTPSNSSGHSIVGNESAAYTGVVIRDCYLEGEQDIFNGWGQYNNTDIRLVNCILVSKFDIFNHSPGTGNTITIEGCTILADGDGNPDSSAGLSGLVTHTGVTMNVRNTRIIMGEAAAGGAGPAIVGVGSGVINLQDCWLTVEAGGYDLQQTSSSTINVTGGRGSGTNGAYSTSGTITHIGADYAASAGKQPLDSDLTAVAALTTTAHGLGLLDDANAAASRTSIGVVIGTDVQAYNANTTLLGQTIESAEITDGTISNGDINAAANIELSKLEARVGSTQSGSWASPITTNPLTATWATKQLNLYYGATGEIDLPAVATYGDAGILIVPTGASTITVDPNGAEMIMKDGVSLGAGVSDVVSGVPGQMFGYHCDGTRWVKFSAGGSGGLLEGSFTGTGTYTGGYVYTGDLTGAAALTISLNDGEKLAFNFSASGGPHTITFDSSERNGTEGTLNELDIPDGRQLVTFYKADGTLIVYPDIYETVTLPDDVTGVLDVAHGGTGLASLGTGMTTFWGTPSSANLRGALTDETGTGSLMFTRTGVLRTFYVAAAAMTPRTTNGPARGTVETGTNDVMYETLDFDQTTEEGAGFWMTMPATWNGSTITAKFQWTAAAGSAAETVVWNIAARGFANDDALDQAPGTEQAASDALIATADMHISATTPAITVGGTAAAGTPTYFQITRDVGTDNLAADALLLGVTIEYTESTTEPSAQ